MSTVYVPHRPERQLDERKMGAPPSPRSCFCG
jgi:hypothetical protein